MTLCGVLQTLVAERLQSANYAETCVTWFDNVVDIAVASCVVRVRELIAVLLLLLGNELSLLVLVLECGQSLSVLSTLLEM